MFVLAERFVLKGNKQQSQSRTTKVSATIKKKVHDYFQFHVYKQRTQSAVTPSYFGKVDLLAITKWLLSVSSLFCVPTGLIIASLQ